MTFFFLGGALKTEKRRDIIVVGEPSRPPTTTILPSALSPRPNEAAQGPSCEAVAGCCRRRCGDGGDACKARASSRRRGSAQPTRLVEGGLGGRARPQPASVALCLPPSLTLSLSKRPAQGRETSSRKRSPGTAVAAPGRLSPPVGREKRSPRKRRKEGRRPTAGKGRRQQRAAAANCAPCPHLPRLPQPRTRRRGTLRRRRRAPDAYLTYGGKPSPDATRARRSQPAAPLLPSPSSPSVRRPRGRRRRRPTSTMLQNCSRSSASFACCF